MKKNYIKIFYKQKKNLNAVLKNTNKLQHFHFFKFIFFIIKFTNKVNRFIYN